VKAEQIAVMTVSGTMSPRKVRSLMTMLGQYALPNAFHYSASYLRMRLSSLAKLGSAELVVSKEDFTHFKVASNALPIDL